MFFDALQAELHKKYDLKPRPIGVKNDNIPLSKKTPAVRPKEKEKETIIVTPRKNSSD
jgi:hypothetical protein